MRAGIHSIKSTKSLASKEAVVLFCAKKSNRYNKIAMGPATTYHKIIVNN